MGDSTWGTVFNRHKARGCDPSDAAYRADQWQKRQMPGMSEAEAHMLDNVASFIEQHHYSPSFAKTFRAFVDRFARPLPHCWHGNALRGGGGETLAPPCGCQMTTLTHKDNADD